MRGRKEPTAGRLEAETKKIEEEIDSWSGEKLRPSDPPSPCRETGCVPNRSANDCERQKPKESSRPRNTEPRYRHHGTMSCSLEKVVSRQKQKWMRENSKNQKRESYADRRTFACAAYRLRPATVGSQYAVAVVPSLAATATSASNREELPSLRMSGPCCGWPC